MEASQKKELIKRTQEAPQWVHFGGGNLYRAFHAEVAHDLIVANQMQTGIIVCETFDEDVIREIYQPYDNEILEVIMKGDGTLETKWLQSTAESHFLNVSNVESYQRMKEVFQNPTLQLVTVTITEKGYSLVGSDGQYTDLIQHDFINGPEHAVHTMSLISSLLYERFKHGATPLALVTTDNFSKNGVKFKASIVTIVERWVANQLVEKEFLDYVCDEACVSFPWTMIDRITPNPSSDIAQILKENGVEPVRCIRTSKNTAIATFANTEETHYLVMEDHFPNGRPPMEMAGVLFTDRETVDKVDAMKVTTCLNPLHTALAIFGCLLGYDLISKEMEDAELVSLIKGIGYTEGLPVIDEQSIIDAHQFIQNVIEHRLPNPLLPDTPQRIATDTSQKVGIRFGETIQKYVQHPVKKVDELVYIPLTIAGWLRYLMGVNDEGKAFTLSSDPLLGTLQAYVAPLRLGDVQSVHDAVYPILSNAQIFGVDLYEIGLANKIESMLTEMCVAEGAVRETLRKYTTTGEVI